ncbi:hypothetical protein M3D01_004125 [Micrococcus luteus]|nr:hypothetical protein [Micrococcus luteus]
MSEPNDANAQVIENATRDDVRPGDHVTWEYTGAREGVTTFERREGIAHHRDSDGDWCAEGGRYITYSEGYGRTITIRRTVQELPTGLGAVIVAKEGGGGIEATVLGRVWHAREAVFGADGRWHGVWRSTSGAISYATPDQITPGTWKVDDR